MRSARLADVEALRVWGRAIKHVVVLDGYDDCELVACRSSTSSRSRAFARNVRLLGKLTIVGSRVFINESSFKLNAGLWTLVLLLLLVMPACLGFWRRVSVSDAESFPMSLCEVLRGASDNCLARLGGKYTERKQMSMSSDYGRDSHCACCIAVHSSRRADFSTLAIY